MARPDQRPSLPKTRDLLIPEQNQEEEQQKTDCFCRGSEQYDGTSIVKKLKLREVEEEICAGSYNQ